MNALSIRILSLALFAALCATATYWVVTLSAREAPLPAAVARPPIPVSYTHLRAHETM